MHARRQYPAGTEGLRRPLLLSTACHGALLSASLAWGFLNPTIHLGSPDAAGGGGIVAVSSVPINTAPARLPNPVANPSQHNVPAPDSFQRSTEVPQPEPETEEAPPAPVPSPERKAAEKQQERSVGQRSAGETKANELRSSLGAALSSDMYQAAPGGALGFGGAKGGPFGQRFGWYAQILQRAIGEQWRMTLGQVSGGSSKPAVITFVIARSGQIGQVAIQQSSGNRSLDYSAVRATNNASPVRPLPRGLGRNSITIEMHFQLD